MYHFQQPGLGVLRLARDDWGDFLFRYAALENRGVRETRVAVTPETHDLLRDEFGRRYLVQMAQFDGLEALGGDVALLETFLSAPPGPAVEVPALAYFLADGDEPPDASAPSDAIVRLRECVEGAHGADFLTRRIEDTHAALAALRPEERAYDEVALSPVEHPRFAPSYSRRYLDLFSALQALRVVQAGGAPRESLLRRPQDAAFALGAEDAARLGGITAVARRELCALMASTRPGAGPAMLVGMARLAAMEETLRTGRWVVLDVHARQARVAPLPDGRLRAGYLDTLERETRADFARSRAEFLAAEGYREAGYAGLESAANRLLEAGSARAGGVLRLGGAVPLPARASLRTDLVRPPWAAAEAHGLLDAARAAEARLDESLRRTYAYDLISRNCVSEVFAVIDSALAADGADRLGGRVTTGANLNFIPLASERAVGETYRVRERLAYPSYRQQQLARMEASEASWRVLLRESNTLTSAAYRPGVNDSEFLFFTQDRIAPRPLLGVANLVWGLGQAAAGALIAPVAGSQRLERGLRGVAFSLPELFFVNLRKGTTAYARRDEVTPPEPL